MFLGVFEEPTLFYSKQTPRHYKRVSWNHAAALNIWLYNNAWKSCNKNTKLPQFSQTTIFLSKKTRIPDEKRHRNHFLTRTNDDRVFRTGQSHTVFNKLSSCSKKSIWDANKNNRLNTQKNIKRLQRAALCSTVFTLIRLWQTYYVCILQNPVFLLLPFCVCRVGTGCSASLCSLAATYHCFWQCVDELPQGGISFLLGVLLLNS